MDKSVAKGIVFLDSVGASDHNEGSRTVVLRRGADITPRPIEWLWPGWIALAKLTLLAGAAGTGKTAISNSIAAVVSANTSWPDGQQSSVSGNVLIWSCEDNPDDTLVPRLMAAHADLTRCYFIHEVIENGKHMAFDPAKDIHELHKAIAQIGGVALLIVDPIVSFVAGDMHRANEVRRSLQALVDLADVHNCAVLGITHFAKGGSGTSPQDRVIGSQAFGALARMVLVAAKEEGGERRVLARAKSNIAPDTGGIEYGIGIINLSCGIDVTQVIWGGAIEGTARAILGAVEYNNDSEGERDLDKLLLDLLNENGGKLSAKQVKAEVLEAGYSWTKANNCKKRLGIESAKEPGCKNGAWHWYSPRSR